MIRLIFNLFKTAFLKLAFSQQSKPVGFEKLSFKFIDSNGERYHRFNEDLDIPVQRKGQIERIMQELEAGISQSELDRFLVAMSKALDGKDKKGNLKPDIPMIGWLIEEMKMRKASILHPDILLELLCAVSIREDEDPAVWDEEIQQQKLIQIGKDCSEGSGLYDFFHKASLRESIPFLDITQGKWNEYLNHSRTKIKAMEVMLQDYSSEKESLKHEATS